MQERSAFVSVLIDGDSMNVSMTNMTREKVKDVASDVNAQSKFLDSLVQQKELGGQDTAYKLRDAVLYYFHRDFPDIHRDVKVVIRVYCNLKGFSKTCCDADIVDKTEDFVRFVRGFNMSDALCDIVDAGSGKECADEKLRGLAAPSSPYCSYDSSVI